MNPKGQWLFLFDLDGTLCDSKELVRSIISDMRAEQLYQKFGRFAEIEFNLFDELSTMQLLRALKLTPMQIYKIADEVRSRMLIRHKEAAFFDEIESQLSLVASWAKIGILSSNSKKFLELKCADLPLEVLLSNKNLFGKSSTLRRLQKQYPGFKLVYIGDELRDAKAAKKAGVPFLGVSWGYDKPEELENGGAGGVLTSSPSLDKELRQFTLAPESLSKR